MEKDESLTKLLRTARPEYCLPAGFEGAVWRRIRAAKAASAPSSHAWLEVLAGWCLRPRFALILAAVMLGLGIFAGINEGTKAARLQARERYLMTVAPLEVR